MKTQRGAAVITALLLTTLAVSLVAHLFWQQQVQLHSIENQRLQSQAQWIMRGAIDWARLILREDLRNSSIDHLGEVWAVPLAETRLDDYVENGRSDADASDATLSGSIVDAQSRFNLTSLCKNGVIDQEQVATFGRLLVGMGFSAELAQATAVMMRTAQRKVDASAGSSTTQSLGVTQVDDLLATPGFSSAMLDRLRNFLVVLPDATPININTASAEVLAANIATLSLAQAAELTAERERAYFRDLNQFIQRLPGRQFADASAKLSLSTRYFIVHGQVRLGRAALQMQALLERNGRDVNMIWMRYR